jgi:hypothetical protein
MYPIPHLVSDPYLPSSKSERNLRTLPEVGFKRRGVKNATRYTCLHRNPFSANDQRITALHNHHVCVVVMDMFHGGRGFTASPECHLASIGSIEHVTLNSGRGLIGRAILLAGCFMKSGKASMALDINAISRLPLETRPLRSPLAKGTGAARLPAGKSSTKLCFLVTEKQPTSIAIGWSEQARGGRCIR